MKVLYITLGGKGGSDKALIDLLSALKDLYNIKPFVVCGRKDIIPDLEYLGIRYVYYNFEWSLYPPTATIRDKILYIPRRIKSILKRHLDLNILKRISNDFKPDLIHTNVGVVDLGYRLGKKIMIPNVWHIREYQTLDHNMHFIGGEKCFKRYLIKNKYNIGITKLLYKYFEMKWPAVQIYDGVREHRLNFLQCNHRNYFVFAGFLFSGKGVDELLLAYKEYCDQGGKYDLYILGTWNKNNKFHNWIASYIEKNKLSKVKLLGFRKDVDKIMANSAAVIVPSKFEAFGRVTCEGMFNKTLVIGKNTGGTKEQFDNIDNFIGEEVSLRYLTEKDLVKRMFEVERMKNDLRSMIIEKSFEYVNAFYTNEVSAKHVYKYYKMVLKLNN